MWKNSQVHGTLGGSHPKRKVFEKKSRSTFVISVNPTIWPRFLFKLHLQKTCFEVSTLMLVHWIDNSSDNTSFPRFMHIIWQYFTELNWLFSKKKYNFLEQRQGIYSFAVVWRLNIAQHWNASRFWNGNKSKRLFKNYTMCTESALCGPEHADGIPVTS